ncbi:MAG: SDR family NAD(P)-dependent oxidoreductase, partial [Pseudomonadota bacterium]
VEAFSQIAKQEKIRTIHLPVSAAFHSEFVADATKPFNRIVNEIQFHKNHFPVLSNTTTDTYPDGIDSQKKLLSKQLAKPVRFVEQIQQLYQQGVHTYIEVGPGNVLSGLIKQILNDDSNQIISIDSSLGKQQGQIDLAMVLIALAAQGKEVSLSMWDAQCESLNRPDLQSKTGMTVKISGANIMQKRSVKPPIESKQVESMMNKQQETTMPNRSNNENSSLKVMQDSILALQKMQEQTARLHQQYLQGQETAQQTINSLLQQQQALLNGQAMPEMTVPQQPAVKSAEPNINKPNVEAQQLPETQDLNEVIEAKNDIEIDNLLLKVVSEKTGYPLEMLSLEMSLDTDLGIDSIKRVEILSALQEELPWSPVIKPEELGTFQFLQHIVEFIAAGKPEHFSGSSAIDKVKDSSIQNIEFEKTLLNIVSDKTGYPIDMLELDMNLDNDLGIDSIKRVEILSALQEALPQLPTISPDELSNLDSLRSISDLIVTEAISIPANHEVSSTLGNHNFSNELLEVVADKTGYPFDMLSLDMNLDSDLGIDSIKRVEILSAIQERMPELPIVDPDTMATLQTLKSIVEYFDVSVDESNNNLSSNDGVITTGLETTLLEVVSEKTGYPVEMLTLDMNLDSDLGIDSIKRVEILSALQDILPNLPSVSADELSALQTLQQIINTMSVEANMVSNEIKKNGSVHADKENKLKKHSLVRHIINPVEINVESFTNIEFDKDKAIYVSGQKYAESICDELISRGYRARKIDASLEDVENVGGLVICHDAIRNQKDILENFSLIQRVSTSLKSNNGFLVAITEMDGCFGFQSLRENNAIHAALTGIIKTADKEWGSVHCRCIDINKPVMSLLVDTFFYQMPLEVGLNDNNLTELKLVEQRLESKQESSLLNNDDLIVISGGARGVTAEIAVKLAETYQCKLLLLGRSPEPEKEPDWLNNLNEEADIKLVLLEKTERKLSPVELEKQFKAVLANREINKTINNIKSHGSEVAYVSVDITDASSIENAIDLTRIELGNVTGVIHAAGVLADKLIEDKTTEQFEYVFNTKVMGLENLLSVTANDNLKLIANFSSTTARLGRKGQVDYAAANEILNKRAQHEQVIRDDCKVLSINWGPWNGGMVTPALKQVFENEGVGLIELEEGANYFIDEIESNGPVEVVVISEAVNNVHLENQFISDSTINNEVLHLAFERELTVSSYQFLQSHVMNGQAVLPVAVIIEWFAHGALHLNPGMQFQGVEDFRVLKGVSLAASESITLRILTADMKQTGNTASVYAELRSDEFLHATALIVLGDAKNIPTDSKLKPIDDRYIFDNDHYYQNGQLFHGQHLQGIKKVSHCGEEGIMAEVNAAPAPSKWMSQPIRSSWITDPLILDSAFQMMIIWSFEQQEIGSLPTEIESYRQYKKKFPKAGVCVVARITHQTDHKAIADIEFIDKKGALVARMQGYTCVRDGSLKQAFQQNDLIEEI